MKKASIYLAALLALAFGIMGCGSSGSTTETGEEAPDIKETNLESPSANEPVEAE